MEQQQSKVSFSVGTKLLVSVVSLLLISITFLVVSTIVLLTNDKRAYTYQAQSTESVLIGREFVNVAKYTLDSLRLYLASFDPLKPISQQQSVGLKAVLENQSQVIAISAHLVDQNSGTSTIITQSINDSVWKKTGLKFEDLLIPVELMKLGLPDLLNNAYAFINISKVGRPPVLAILMSDLKLKTNSTGIPVAIGFVPLDRLATEVKASAITVVNREGWVLFTSDPAEFHNKKNIADDPLYELSISSQLTTGAKEYEHEGRRFLGSYFRPGYDLIVLTKTDWRVAMRSAFALTEKLILLGLMGIGAAIVFAILFAKTLTAPINRLYEATKEVAAGNFDVKLAAKSGDEIGSLASSFVVMSKKINELIQESMRKVHLENELAIASTVQQNLIPPPEFKNEFLEIRGHYQSAAECGGDWWGFFGVGDKLCLMIADATGHGLPSALITASARSCFSVMHKLAQEDSEFSFSPGAMLAYANRVVYEAANGKIMMTFWSGVFDFGAKKLSYSSAGHNPPWLFRKEAGGGFKLKSLKATGPRLGEQHDVPMFTENSVPIGPDDVLFLYTDGLLEGRNAGGEMFGKRKAMKTVEENLNKGPEAVIKILMDGFLKHNGNKPFDDDVTLAVARVLHRG